MDAQEDIKTALPVDPFRAAREGAGTQDVTLHGEDLLMLLRWRDVRAAARDPEHFDSAHLGRVPTPQEVGIRSFRQLPIEANPPEHTAWRDLVQPYFRRPTQDGPKAEFEALVRDELDALIAGADRDIVAGFALPLQSKALAILLDTDRGMAADWVRWGLHAFRTAGQTDPDKARRFLDFIDAQLDAAGGADDPSFFAYLGRARIEGRPLTRDEMRGICHLALSGGRDTVINSITAVFAHLAATPGDLDRLSEDPGLVPGAAEEIFRFISPLPQIGRVCPAGYDHPGGGHVDPGDRAALCWASANRDAEVFDAPEVLRIDRKPNPHVAFGAGAHTCLGAPMARLLVRTLLAELARRRPTLRVVAAGPRANAFGTPYLFETLQMSIAPGGDR